MRPSLPLRTVSPRRKRQEAVRPQPDMLVPYPAGSPPPRYCERYLPSCKAKSTKPTWSLQLQQPVGPEDREALPR
jgi:hypothetical protein